MPRARHTLALALACAAPAAQATPPDAFAISDQLFGISADTVFLLRTGSDNMGLYAANRRGVALVLIDRRTGDETLLPVYRSFRFPDFDQPDSARTTIRADALPGAIDPFAILRDHGGEAIVAGADTAPRPVDHIPPDLRAKVQHRLDAYAALMGDYRRMGPLTLPLLVADSTAACRADHAVTPDDQGAETPATLIRVLCGDPDTDDITAALYLPAPG